MTDKMMLVDGDNILIRAERAMQRSRLSADGIPTAALHVFITCLSRHVREERPDQVMVCWDGGRSKFRLELYPKYKANRVKRVEAEDYVRPHGLAKEWLTRSGVPHVERAGWEADDLIAFYCQEVWDRDIVIISSDHDLLQLVRNPSTVDGRYFGGVTQVKLATGSSETDRWDLARVQEHFRLPAGPDNKLNLVCALTGDSGDGVPGLAGIGPVKAGKLLAGAGWDWETLLAQFDADPAREGWRGTAELAYALTDLCNRPYIASGLMLLPPGRFRPTAPGDALFGDLLTFLEHYQLRTVQDRLSAGELWAPAVPA